MVRTVLGKLPDFENLLRRTYGGTSPRVWTSDARLYLKLRLRHQSEDGSIHETVALYGDGWSDMVDYIVSMELQILTKS